MSKLRFPHRVPFLGVVAAVVLGTMAAWRIAERVDRPSGFSTSSPYYDVRDYGAIGNGVAKDTKALQATIDSAARNGGGVVVLPPGTYLSGTIHLRSNVTLWLMGGATLAASRDDRDFDPYEAPPAGSLSSGRLTWTVGKMRLHSALRPAFLRETADNPDTTYSHYALVVGDNLSNIDIDGLGTIEGNRTTRGGLKLIALKSCRHVSIRNLTLRDAPSYNISLIGSEDVDLEGLRILNGYADGIDPDGSKYVRIANCYIDTWDDAICAKASLALGHPMSTENLVVTNCILKTSNSGFKFGTESEGNLRNVALSNCVMLRRDHGRAPITGVAIESVDGGKVDGVVVSNVVMRDVRTPIFLRLGDRGRGMAVKHPGAMRDINISDIVATGATHPISIHGLPGAPIQAVTLSNIQVSERGGHELLVSEVPELPRAYPQGEMFGSLPGYSVYARHVDDLTISNLRAGWQENDIRPAAVFDDIRGLEIAGLRADAGSKSEPLVFLRDVTGALVKDVSVGDHAPLINSGSGDQNWEVRNFPSSRHIAWSRVQAVH